MQSPTAITLILPSLILIVLNSLHAPSRGPTARSFDMTSQFEAAFGARFENHRASQRATRTLACVAFIKRVFDHNRSSLVFSTARTRAPLISSLL
jgi:hypothetical protein